MSENNIFNETKYQFGRFVWPAVIAILGFYLYFKTKVPQIVEQYDPNTGEMVKAEYYQPLLFGIAGLFLVFVAVVWVLYVLNFLRSIIGVLVMLVSLFIAGYVLYIDNSIIEDEIAFQQKEEEVLREIKGRLNDIKLAEQEYKKEHGVFTPNADSLIDFVKNGKTISYVRSGVTPARPITKEERKFLYNDNRPLDKNMTDVEAKALTKMPNPPADLEGYVRDTVYIPVMESVFNSESYLSSRNPNLLFDFNPDSLKYIPFSGKEVLIDTSSVSKGELKVPTILIQMPYSLKKYDRVENENKEFTDTLRIGDLNDNTLKDNWSL